MKKQEKVKLRFTSVNAKGVHKTIDNQGNPTMSRIFFEDKSNRDVDNSVIFQILQAHYKAAR